MVYNRLGAYRRPGQRPGPAERRRIAIEPRELANVLMELVAAKKASHITLLDLRGVSIIADYFLICSGESERQLKAIAEEVQEKLDAQGITPRRVEGTPESGWILLDYSAVIVHIFDVTRRSYYQLEEVWQQARTLAVMP